MDISYRYIDAKSYDRIFDIRNKIGSYNFSDDDLNYLQVIKIRKDSEKFKSLSNVIEHRLCRRHDFPLMVRNLPPVAEFSDSNTPDKVRAVDVKNTFAQFDEIEKFELIRGTAYIKYKNNISHSVVYNTVNNMMIGGNIIQTVLVQ